MAKEPKVVKNVEKSKEVQPAPVTRVLTPFEEMDRMFESIFPGRWARPFRWEHPSWIDVPLAADVRVPRVDVLDRDGEIVVKAEVPGVEKKDLDISVSDNSVTIRGSTQREEKEERGDYVRAEISRGSFSRTVALPADVDGEKAKASFKDGVLALTLPKLAKSKRRRIPVE